jgi:hypothetical protein
LQAELRRVGCNPGAVDGNWNAASQHSLDLFNKYAATKLDVKIASADALEVVKSKAGRVCPLVCEHGFRADGGSCMRTTCRVGYRVNDDNECEKVQNSSAEPSRVRSEQIVNPNAAGSKAPAEGDTECSKTHHKLKCLCAIQRGGRLSSNGRRWLSLVLERPATMPFVQYEIRAGMQ